MSDPNEAGRGHWRYGHLLSGVIWCNDFRSILALQRDARAEVLAALDVGQRIGPD